MIKKSVEIKNIVYIALGSNLDNPIDQVNQAFQSLAHLPDSDLLKQSPLYRSVPLDLSPQPDYVNAVAELKTTLSPLTLLSHLQMIEQQQGRVRTEQRWSPRTLDLDLLLYNQQKIQHPLLTVPHHGLYTRNFVLYPLYDCAPQLVLPNGQKLRDLIQHCSMNGLCRI